MLLNSTVMHDTLTGDTPRLQHPRTELDPASSAVTAGGSTVTVGPLKPWSEKTWAPNDIEQL